MTKKTHSILLFCCSIFFIGFFIGCNNPISIEGEVSIKENDRVPQIEVFTLTKTTDNRYFILSWDAIASDVGYSLYFKQAGKLSITAIGYYYDGYSTSVYPQNRYKYKVANGEQVPNDDFDKWSVRIDSLETSSPGDYCFGIRTNSNETGRISSEIKWSEPFTVTKAPNVASVAAVKTTSGSGTRYVIATWDAVEGANQYSARQEVNGTIYSVESAQNDYVYSIIDGSSTANQNPVKWSLKSYSTSASRIGVIASSSDICVVAGDIVWSNIIE
jgi:hypothetical protein